jgi:hypothetical protein
MKRKLLPMSGYQMGGGGSGGGPNTTYSQTSNIPEYARPYVEQMLGAGQKEIFNTDAEGNPTGIKPYQPFSNDPNSYFAGFSPMQQQAQQQAQNMQVTPETGMASGIAGAAGIGALGTNYQAGQFSNQFQDPGQYQPGQFSMMQAQGPSLQNYQMQGPQNVRSQQFGQQQADQYMNPYMQNVVNVQQSAAQRQADIARTGRNAQATQAGAFGGSRQAIMDAEANRALADQQGAIQAQGLNTAYSQAQQQFNADQAQRMQAALANQGMGYNVGQQNLSALLNTQQLGAGQNLQSQLANQQAFQQAQAAAEQSRQYGAGQGLQSANLGAQYGQAAQAAAEQSRQYGAGLNMQGLQTGLSAAGQLGQLGQNIYGQQMGINQLQNQYGTQQQQLEQSKINQQIQDYATAQQYPMMQLANMNALTRGLPMQAATTQVYQAAPSAASQLAGLGLAGYGLSQLGGMGGSTAAKAKGGSVKEKKRPAGLAELALMKMQ